MKQLTCELCNGTEFVKQDGTFVCQGCGTKYSLEDAKKMMTESPVEIPENRTQTSAEPSVVVPSENAGVELDNLYTLARRALDAKDYAAARQYYEKIVVFTPQDWEANFFSAYCDAMTVSIAGMISAASIFEKRLRGVQKLVLSVKDGERKNVVKTIGASVCTFTETYFAAAKNYCLEQEGTLQRIYGSGSIEDSVEKTKRSVVYRREMADRYVAAIQAFYAYVDWASILMSSDKDFLQARLAVDIQSILKKFIEVDKYLSENDRSSYQYYQSLRLEMCPYSKNQEEIYDLERKISALEYEQRHIKIKKGPDNPKAASAVSACAAIFFLVGILFFKVFSMRTLGVIVFVLSAVSLISGFYYLRTTPSDEQLAANREKHKANSFVLEEMRTTLNEKKEKAEVLREEKAKAMGREYKKSSSQ